MTSRDQPVGDEAANWVRAASSQLNETQQRFRAILDDNRRQLEIEQRRLREIDSRISDLRKEIKGANGGTTDAAPGQELTRLRQNQQGLTDKIAQLEDAGHRLLTAINRTELLFSYLAEPVTSREESRADPGDLASIRLLTAQEEEHQRLAREIHDGPAQVLAHAIFILEYCLQLIERDREKARIELNKLGDDLRAGLKEVRSLISDLRPGSVAEMGLKEALKHYGNQSEEQFGLHIEMRIDPLLPRLSPHKEMAIFRIVQEAMRNVRKHSGVNLVQVDITCRGPTMVVAVEDKGAGFDQNKEISATRFGVHGMHERALLVGGELSIVSAPGQGTRVELRVPFGASGRQSHPGQPSE